MKLDTKDWIKLCGFLIVTTSMWYDLKTDYAVHKATTELRLKNLEEKITACLNYSAILPKETKIENDK